MKLEATRPKSKSNTATYNEILKNTVTLPLDNCMSNTATEKTIHY
jgi:hypothetical protein